MTDNEIRDMLLLRFEDDGRRTYDMWSHDPERSEPLRWIDGIVGNESLDQACARLDIDSQWLQQMDDNEIASPYHKGWWINYETSKGN